MQHTNFVIFDMDGLLFDTERLVYQAFKQSLEQLGYTFSMDVYRKQIGMGKQEEAAILKDVYGDDLDMDAVARLSDAAYDHLRKTERLQVMPGAHELLDALDRQNIRKCIASSSPVSDIEQNLAMTNMADRFDFYVGGDEVERGKPYPDIFNEAIRRAAIDPGKALVLEDSLNGLRAAENASIRCVVVPDLIEPNDEMRRDAYEITDHLANLVEWFEE